jgi:hypothetical protein
VTRARQERRRIQAAENARLIASVPPAPTPRQWILRGLRTQRGTAKPRGRNPLHDCVRQLRAGKNPALMRRVMNGELSIWSARSRLYPDREALRQAKVHTRRMPLDQLGEFIAWLFVQGALTRAGVNPKFRCFKDGRKAK